MGKINVGLRGWRFDEDEVLGEDGRVRPIGTMEPETRQRVLRLAQRVTDPCDCCWLKHGPEDRQRCRQGAVIYGEPGAEVLVCAEHEPDFVYWFREAGGADLAGSIDLAEEFHAWFLDGGRATENYAGVEHVDEDPDALPDPPDIKEGMPGLEEELEAMDEDDLKALDVDFSDIDL
jgi:hypothetical protein